MPLKKSQEMVQASIMLSNEPKGGPVIDKPSYYVPKFRVKKKEPKVKLPISTDP